MYYAVDMAIMFARTNMEGHVSFISDKFLSFLGKSSGEINLNVFSMLNSPELCGNKLDKVLVKLHEGEIWSNEVNIALSGKTNVWLMVTIVPVPDAKQKIKQMVMVCNDITIRKKAEEQLKQATREQHQRDVEEQKEKSALILEGQEKERRRIAREIHDGIGQLLTGLKFQLESMEGSVQTKDKERLVLLQKLTGDIIKEVRRVSHNLTPSVLNDYGLVSALHNMVAELDGYTNTKIDFENLTGFVGPFRQKN
ncbi:MAG: PAS domain-containing protein [Bacteroidales bacterium]|nr:PAS domain-containing protein [Bacteroidales bacterium]